MNYNIVISLLLLNFLFSICTSTLSEANDFSRSPEATVAALQGFNNAQQILSEESVPSAQRIYEYDYSKFSINDETINYYLEGSYPEIFIIAQFLDQKFLTSKSNAIQISFSDFSSILRKGDGVALSDGFTNHVTLFSHHNPDTNKFYFLDQDPEHFFLLDGKNVAGIKAKIYTGPNKLISLSHEEFLRVWRGGTMLLSFDDLIQFKHYKNNYRTIIEISSRGRTEEYIEFLKREYAQFDIETMGADIYASFFTAFNRIGIDGNRYRKLSKENIEFIQMVIPQYDKFDNQEVDQYLTYDFYLELCELFRYEMPELLEFIYPMSQEMLKRNPDDESAQVFYLAALVRSGQKPDRLFFENTLHEMRNVFNIIDQKNRKNPVSELFPAREGSSTLKRLYANLYFTYELYVENRISEKDWISAIAISKKMLADFPSEWKPRAFLTITLAEAHKCVAAQNSFKIFKDTFDGSSNPESPFFPYWKTQYDVTNNCK